jgi:HEAT repeat protein
VSLDHCIELEQGLRDPRWANDGEGLMAWLKGLTRVEDCIAEGLRRASAVGDWLMFERYLLAAYHHPSRAFTVELCEVLDRQIEDVNNEDIVDVLAEIADPTAVGCLEGALWWHPQWDEYRQLAVKCVWALAATGTPEAMRVLREAANSEAAPVREAAARKLGLAGA